MRGAQQRHSRRDGAGCRVTRFLRFTDGCHRIISKERLNKVYFRRWFCRHGISRALLYKQARINMEAPEETTLDYAHVPHIAGVPRYTFRTYLHTAFDMAKARLRRDEQAGFERELELWFLAGVVKQRWQDRHK
jgi:hypothetical protein